MQEEALETYIRANRTKWVHYARAVFSLGEDAEDVVQQACFLAHRARDTYDPRYPYETWFRSILVNAARAHLRGARRAPVVSLERMPPLVDLAANVESMALKALEWEEIARAVAEAIQRLPDRPRALLVAAYLREQPRAALAEELHCSANALRLRLQHVRRRLRAVLDPRRDTEVS